MITALAFFLHFLGMDDFSPVAKALHELQATTYTSGTMYDAPCGDGMDIVGHDSLKRHHDQSLFATQGSEIVVYNGPNTDESSLSDTILQGDSRDLKCHRVDNNDDAAKEQSSGTFLQHVCVSFAAEESSLLMGQ
jgi:hypothetical protein